MAQGLDDLSVWTQKFQALPAAPVAAVGAQNFAAMLGGLMNKVVAGPSGLPGIFTFDQATFATQLATLVPPGTTWPETMATAWQTACQSSIITPGTVVDPIIWTASTVDISTIPSASTTILTLSAAYDNLLNELQQIADQFTNPPDDTSQVATENPQAMAKAFRDSTLKFVFNCIGLAEAIVPIPVPVPTPAQ